jgi:hypothetical protein
MSFSMASGSEVEIAHEAYHTLTGGGHQSAVGFVAVLGIV